jgi:hypothetical protein
MAHSVVPTLWSMAASGRSGHKIFGRPPAGVWNTISLKAVVRRPPSARGLYELRFVKNVANSNRRTLPIAVRGEQIAVGDSRSIKYG